MKSKVVECYSKIFGMFGWISILRLLELIPPLERNKAFIDIWALGNFLLSILCLTVIPSYKNISIIYGCVRIFEIIIVQINLLLFDQFRAATQKRSYFVTSFRRTVLLLIHNYLEIMIWLASFYHTFYYFFDARNICLNTVLGSFYFSLVTMTTLGYGDITPKTQWGTLIVIIQTLIGFFMALLLLARFVALLPKPKSIDFFERDKNG